MKRVTLKAGDILQLPLPDGSYAIAQIVFLDLKKGAPPNPLLRVVRGVYSKGEEVDLNKVDLTDQLFPPVITGVGAAVKMGYWNKIGNKPVEEFSYPKFLTTNWSETTGEAGYWAIRNENGTFDLGFEVPEELKSLEFYVVLAPTNVIKRIATGEITFPYGDLIKYNKFTPVAKPREITKEEKDEFSKRAFGKK